MDRWRRQRALIITSVVRAVALASVPVLLLTDALDFWSLATVVLVLGVLTLFGDSAAQPFLPRIVPRNSLVMANARLGQSETVARTVGPALGGALLNLVGAPILFVFEGAINAIAAVLQSRIRVDEPRPEPRPHGRHTGHDIADGMRYTYQHRTLRPPAISVHTWFLANSIVSTVFAVFVLRELDMPAWGYGVALAWVLLSVRCALRPTTLSGLAGLAGHRSIGRGSTADLQVRIEAAAPGTCSDLAALRNRDTHLIRGSR